MLPKKKFAAEFGLLIVLSALASRRNWLGPPSNCEDWSTRRDISNMTASPVWFVSSSITFQIPNLNWDCLTLILLQKLFQASISGFFRPVGRKIYS